MPDNETSTTEQTSSPAGVTSRRQAIGAMGTAVSATMVAAAMPALDAQALWVSSDWIHFFRTSLEQRLGGVAIEMAGSVGSVESPEVYNQAISRTPQQFVDAGTRPCHRG